jgi:hypothetical protein
LTLFAPNSAKYTFVPSVARPFGSSCELATVEHVPLVVHLRTVAIELSFAKYTYPPATTMRFG